MSIPGKYRESVRESTKTQNKTNNFSLKWLLCTKLEFFSHTQRGIKTSKSWASKNNIWLHPRQKPMITNVYSSDKSTDFAYIQRRECLWPWKLHERTASLIPDLSPVVQLWFGFSLRYMIANSFGRKMITLLHIRALFIESKGNGNLYRKRSFMSQKLSSFYSLSVT